MEQGGYLVQAEAAGRQDGLPAAIRSPAVS